MHWPEPHDAAQLGMPLDAAPAAPPESSAVRPGRSRGTRSHRPAPSARTEAEAARYAAQDRVIERLEAVALAVGAMRTTFRLDHVRALAEKAGVLTGQEGRPHPDTGRLQEPRALAFLGRLMPGLVDLELVEAVLVDGEPLFQRSDRPGSGGNLQAVWRLTNSGKAAARGLTLSEIESAIAARRSHRP